MAGIIRDTGLSQSICINVHIIKSKKIIYFNVHLTHSSIILGQQCSKAMWTPLIPPLRIPLLQDFDKESI